MPKKRMFNFEHSYLSLPSNFYSLSKPSNLSNSSVLLFNKPLAKEIELNFNYDLIPNLLHHKSFAQSYSGHQFGHFTNLGDGRAIVIGEHISKNKRFDIQLKGCGKTKYSRGGDGKATLKSVIREYLMSEMLTNLGIKSSRSLAIIDTGQKIYRNELEKGGILVRSMESHIRVGTFEFASYLGSIEDLRKLTNYVVKRLFPEIINTKNLPLSLLERVMNYQIELVVSWKRVGFIHGVMNTDNISISGETIDYGPCAFMNRYDYNTVYSSIDKFGRYSFGNQGIITKWNISRFAEALLPLIHNKKDIAIKLAQNTLNKFDDLWNKKFYEMMSKKIGFDKVDKEIIELIDKLLKIMQKHKFDYTNTFYNLYYDKIQTNKCTIEETENWLKDWKKINKRYSNIETSKLIMKKNNPWLIPRNHNIESSINSAVNGDMKLLNNLISSSTHSYDYNKINLDLMTPPSEDYDQNYKTYCGT